MINGGTKAAVFPYPITTQSSIRIPGRIALCVQPPVGRKMLANFRFEVALLMQVHTCAAPSAGTSSVNT
jgi:hypothetical protein